MKLQGGERAARVLLERGPSTAPQIAEVLGLTVQAVRRHLDALVADGLVDSSSTPPYGPRLERGRGRPPRVYALTEAGRDSFDQSYDDLAVDALRFMRDSVGEDVVAGFAEERAERLVRRYGDLSSASEPAHDLAAKLTRDGYAASVVGDPDPATPVQICQHHCPVEHVAAEFPQLCDAETDALGQILGRHVTRLATIAHGDGVCTTLISPRRPSSGATSDDSREPTTIRNSQEARA